MKILPSDNINKVTHVSDKSAWERLPLSDSPEFLVLNESVTVWVVVAEDVAAPHLGGRAAVCRGGLQGRQAQQHLPERQRVLVANV